MTTDKIRSRVIQNKIDSIFEHNKLNDLKKFIAKRECLNSCNILMLYLFHIIQSVGILINSYGVSINNNNFIWIGIFLNMLATLIQVFEKLNNVQLKRLLRDIEKIKEDRYIDETPFVDVEQYLSSYAGDIENDLLNTDKTNTNTLNYNYRNIKSSNNNNIADNIINSNNITSNINDDFNINSSNNNYDNNIDTNEKSSNNEKSINNENIILYHTKD